MTDGEVARIAMALQRHGDQMASLMNRLEQHPNADALLEDLHENDLGCNWDFGQICHPHLVHPDRWRVDKTGRLRYIANESAKPTDG